MSDKQYFAHETAIVDEGANIGAGTRIWHFSHILGGSNISYLDFFRILRKLTNRKHFMSKK